MHYRLKKTAHLIALIIALISNPSFSQFNYYSLDEGLSQSHVRNILYDRNGFLWVGTQDGLNRFDGYQFTHFRREVENSNSLPGNYISSLAEDKNGNILIGTINGAALYNPFTNRITRIPNKTFQIGSVSSFIQSKEGSFWIGSYYSGVYKITDNKIEHFTKGTHPTSISDNYTTALCQDSLGNIWIGTFGFGLTKYNTSKKLFEKIDLLAKNSSNTINSLIAFSQNSLLVGTTNGLIILNTVTNQYSLYKIDGIKNNVLHVYLDGKNNIWLALEGEGVYLFNYKDKLFTKVPIEEKNNSNVQLNNIQSIHQDNNGNMWFGTSTNGLVKWKKNKNYFHSISNKTLGGLLSNYSIRSVFKDNDGNIWVGTDFGLNKINSKTKQVKQYFHNPNNSSSINDNKVWSIASDLDGNVWFGTQRGLAKYQKQSDSFERYIYRINTNEDSPVFPIRSIYIDKDNLLWFGTFGAGLFSFDIKNKKFQNHTFTNSNKDAKKDVVIFHIKEDDNKRLWLAAASGLAVYNKKTKNYSRYFSDSNNELSQTQCVFYAIEIENDSTFWLGTLGDGLIKFNPIKNKSTFLNDKDGMPNNIVYGLLRDSKRNLWLSTNYGISKYNTLNNEFKNYDKNDGIPTNEFNTGAFTYDSKGNLFFGGIEGLLYFNPDSIGTSSIKPKLAVVNFKVFDKTLFPGKVFFNNQTINLNYTQNFFSFEFSSLDLTSSPKNEYSYMLEGYDKKIIYSSQRRYAAYTNVEPGKYTLLLKASNADRLWNDEGIKIYLIIYPPFWATIWFYVLVSFLLIASTVLLIRHRILKIRKVKELQQNYTRQLIESQENERKRIASELHDSIGQNLVVIKNRAIIALNTPQTQVNQMEEILNITSQTIGDVRAIAYNLRPYQLGKIGLTKAIEAVINQGIQSSQIHFTFSVDNIDNSVTEENEIHLYRIIQECIANALKHSSAKSVSLSIKKESNKIILHYSDDGIGFDFESEIASPSGLGISNLLQRVKLLQGVINIESKKGIGSKILITFPLKPGNEK